MITATSMNAVPRNPTVRFSRKADEFRNNGDEEGTRKYNPNLGWRVFSTRRSKHREMMMNSFSYRRDHARKRHIFLQTYKLGGSVTKPRHTKLEKIGQRVKSAAASVLSFLRGGSAFRSGDSRKAVRGGSSPEDRVTKIC